MEYLTCVLGIKSYQSILALALDSSSYSLVNLTSPAYGSDP